MAASPFYRQSPSVRTRCATPMTADLSRLAPTDHTMVARMSRNQTASPSRNGHHKVSDYTGDSRPMVPAMRTMSDYHITGADLKHAGNYYNPARQQIYKRYTVKDWDSSNSSKFQLSDKERANAEKLRMDAWQTIKMTEQKTKVRQTDVSKKLGERVNDISFWKSQLQDELSMQEKEQENLKEHIRILEMSLSNSEKPLQIAEECLIQREKRRGIDQVKDEVERSLIKEVSVIKNCQDRMRKIVEQAKIQMKMNRAAQHELDKDSKDKHHAQNIDDRIGQLKNCSSEIALYPGAENIDHTVTVPHSWVKYTQENIHRSQKNRSASEKLRGDMETLLRACANQMWTQFNAVNNALNSRIQDVTGARNKLQAHLNRTIHEIFDVEKTIQMLRKAIADKEAPLKVALTRLQERTTRINVELCNDPAMKTLQTEVQEIRNSIESLQDQLRSAETALARLAKTRSTLESDISVKENSLSIDDKVCLGMRKTFPMEPNGGPIYGMPLTY